MRAWKERGLRRLAVRAADLVVDVVPRPAADVITYIPADRDRSVRRGHHPAQRLARELATRWGMESRPLLARTRPVARQAGLTLPQRRTNVRGAFRSAVDVVPRGIVLVDDVYTTGATVTAAASALRAGGARRVDVVTFARVVR